MVTGNFKILMVTMLPFY